MFQPVGERVWLLSHSATNLAGFQKVNVANLIYVWLYRSHEVSKIYVYKFIFMHLIVEGGLVTGKKTKSQRRVEPKLLTEPAVRRLD